MVFIAIDKQHRQILGYLCKNDRSGNLVYCCGACEIEFPTSKKLEKHMQTHEQHDNDSAEDKENNEPPVELEVVNNEQPLEPVQNASIEANDASIEENDDQTPECEPVIDKEQLLMKQYQVQPCKVFLVRLDIEVERNNMESQKESFLIDPVDTLPPNQLLATIEDENVAAHVENIENASPVGPMENVGDDTNDASSLDAETIDENTATETDFLSQDSTSANTNDENSTDAASASVPAPAPELITTANFPVTITVQPAIVGVKKRKRGRPSKASLIQTDLTPEVRRPSSTVNELRKYRRKAEGKSLKKVNRTDAPELCTSLIESVSLLNLEGESEKPSKIRRKADNKANNLAVNQIQPTTTEETERETKLPFKCDICSKPFKRHPMLQKHMAKHLSFVCFLCGQKYATNEQLVEHEFKTHQIGNLMSPVIPCHICGKNVTNMKKHLRQHEIEQNAPNKIDETRGEKPGEDRNENAAEVAVSDNVAEESAEEILPAAEPIPVNGIAANGIAINGAAENIPTPAHEEVKANEAIAMTESNEMSPVLAAAAPSELNGTAPINNELPKVVTSPIKVKALPFPCNICPRTFRLQILLSQHMQKHEKTYIPCKICGKMLTPKYMYTHVKRYHPAPAVAKDLNVELAAI